MAAKQWVCKMPDQHDAETMFAFARNYLRGGPLENVLKWYRKAADAGHGQAGIELELFSFWQGWVDTDWALRTLLVGSEEFRAGCYFAGAGVDSWDKALECWEEAAEKGDDLAKFALVCSRVDEDEEHQLIPAYGLGLVILLDRLGTGAGPLCVEYFRMAAEAGHLLAQLALADHYASYMGRDEAAAVHWYRHAAKQGSVLAHVALGSRYADGVGIGKDDSMAVTCYRAAAEQGEIRAQFYLGVCYATGRGVSQDDLAAESWWERAAAADGHVFLERAGLPKSHHYNLSLPFAEKARFSLEIGRALRRGNNADYSKIEQWYQAASHMVDLAGPFLENKPWDVSVGARNAAVIQLASGRSIRMTEIAQDATYGGWVFGTPSHQQNEAIIQSTLSSVRERYFGLGYLIRPTETPLPPDPHDPKQPERARLPFVRCVAEFSSGPVVIDESHDISWGLSMFSNLVLVWFQDEFALPIDSAVVEQIRLIEWERYAQDGTP